MALAIAKAGPLRPEIRLSQALQEFESILSPEQKQSYDKSSPDVSAVMALTCEVDRQTAGRKTRRWGARLTSFLNSIHGFTTVVDSVVSNMGSPIAGAIWGAVKVAIQTASCYQAYFDSLSTMLMNNGLSSPRIEKYALLYPSSPTLQKELCNYYSVVINLCTRIVVFVRKPIARQIANALRKSFEDEFGSFQRELSRLGTAVKEEASIAAKQQQNVDSKEGARERKESALYRATGTRFRKETASELAQLRKMREGILKSRFLTSCSKYNPEISLNQARRKGASKWILQSKDYQHWRDTINPSTLLCSGIVGSGKTVVCASVIEDLTINKPMGSHLAYFFCRYDEAVSLNAREIIGSVARQFFQDLPVEALRLKGKDLNDGMAMFDIQRIADAMLLLLPHSTRYIMVLDGLDECEWEEISALIYCLRFLMRSPDHIFKVFWSGRTDYVSKISQQLRPDFQVQISSLNSGSEISDFVEVALGDALESGKLKLGCPEIIVQIREALEAGSNEMFLWVVFQIDSICAQNSDHDILNSLQDLPKGLPATFRRIIRRLQDSALANSSLAKKILEIVAVAQRPLNLEELGEAISVTPGDTLWDNSKLVNDVLKSLECCGSLLVVDEEFSTVHFAHSSVKEHLITEPTDLDIVDYHIDPAKADSNLGRLCVTYLNLDVFSSQLTKSNGQSRSYAVNVPATVVQSTLSKHESIKKIAITMLKSRRTLKNDSSLDFQQNADIIRTDARMKNNFCLLSYCQENWLHHTKKIHRVQLLPENEIYELWERLVRGSITTVELPWAPEEIRSCGELLMSWLRANAHPALTRKTIEELWEHQSTMGDFSAHPLSVGRRKYDLLEELLGFLSDKDEWRTLNLGDTIGSHWMEVVLQKAVAYGCKLFVELLLQRRAKWNTQPKLLNRVLYVPISKNNKDMVALLVDNGADISHSVEGLGTALHAAALEYGNIPILELLIDKGADVNAIGGRYGTALIAAASCGNVRAIELLVSAGADIHYCHEKHGTALIASISDPNRTRTVETLLNQGADVNTQGGEYGTALIKAVSFGTGEATISLLDSGADVNARSVIYGTALDVSLERFFTQLIFNCLIGSGADVNYKSPGRDSPLVSAVKNNISYAVTALLKAGADIKLTGETTSSLLKIAAKQDCEGVVRTLLYHHMPAAAEKLEVYSSWESKKTIKETMRVLETNEKMATIICKILADDLRRWNDIIGGGM